MWRRLAEQAGSDRMRSTLHHLPRALGDRQILSADPRKTADAGSSTLGGWSQAPPRAAAAPRSAQTQEMAATERLAQVVEVVGRQKMAGYPGREEMADWGMSESHYTNMHRHAGPWHVWLIAALSWGGLSAPAADLRHAVVRGTNVIDIVVFDPDRPPPPRAGAITIRCPVYVERGWSYAAPPATNNWLTPTGALPPPRAAEKSDRADLLDSSAETLRLALKNWDALTTSNRTELLKLHTRLWLISVTERREELELTDE
jgi:hypothetical protein